MNNLLVRVLTAIVAIPVLLGLLYWAPWWGFFALGIFGVVVAASELAGMTLKDQRPQQAWAVAASLGIYCLLYFSPTAQVLSTTIVGAVATGFLIGLIAPDPIETAGARLAWLIVTPLYAGGLLAAIALLHRTPNGGSWVVLSMMLAWLGDTGAYFAGKGFGKHKLYEKVSPKKTIEGSIGGTLGSVGGAVFMHFTFLPELPLLHAVGLGVVASILGQAGDLAVSLVKRSAKVKDSGWIVPGHGGLLDRIDSLVMTGAATWAYTVWFLP
ncbi:MAG: phosphatidate cytidylyltransferase [Myxococcota bacterium]